MSNHNSIDRVAWIDAGRGISILLVVLLHSENWLAYAGFESRTFDAFNSVAIFVRMPLFFLVSGILAARIVQSSWRELVSRRLYLLVWVFVVWQPVVFVYKYAAALWLPNQEDPSLFAHLARMFLSLARPNGETWFLWALAVFLIIARGLRNASGKVQLTVTGAVSIVWLTMQYWVIPEGILRLIGDGWKGLFSYGFFFFLGIVLSRSILLRVSRLLTWHAVLAVFAGVAAMSATVLMGAETVPVVSWLLRVVGVLTGIAMSTLVGRVVWLVYCGRRTLPIYLAHTFFIVVISCAAYLMGVPEVGDPIAGVVVLGAAGVAVSCSLILYNLAQRSGAFFLYDIPDRIRARIDRLAFRERD